MRFYRLLLRLYPESFRAEYGAEMTAVLAARLERSRDLVRAFVWLGALFDVLANAPRVHFDILRQDLRYTARALAAVPGFTLTTILVIALGIGANTAAFSLADNVFIRPLPFHEPDRLVQVWEDLPGYSRMEFSPANYRDWMHMNGAFSAMGAYGERSWNLLDLGQPQRIEGALVSANLFRLLGVQPVLGRGFLPEDDRDGAPLTMILSWGMWQSQFGGDRAVLGRKLRVDGTPCTVIGVMPADFHFPTTLSNYWVPMQLAEDAYQDRNDNWLNVIARLRPGVSLQQASADATLVAARLRRAFPADNKNLDARIVPVREEIGRQTRVLLLALCGASLCILLIACANVASLLLARALGRRRELAVRAALGAGRSRLVRQLTTESLILALLGGLLGIAIAYTSAPILKKLTPENLPLAHQPGIDTRVLIFAGVLTVLTGLAFGVVPALRACAGPDLKGLHEGQRSGGGQRERLRAALVIAEVAISVVLLVSSGLLMRALWRVQTTDPGFRADGVLTMRTVFPSPKYDSVTRRAAFYRHVLDGARALPGVSHAAYITYLPMVVGGGIWPVSIGGKTLDRSEGHTASMRFVTPGFFATMGIPIRLGRDVSDSDSHESLYTAVVSESFVRHYWPGEDPVGRHFDFGMHNRTIVGVAGDIRVRGFEQSSEPQVYLPYLQVDDGELVGYVPKALVVRAAGDVTTLIPALSRLIYEADPEQPISYIETMNYILEERTASRALQARILGAFAALAFLLAAVGIHGLLAFTVSQRANEIGVRVALGATPAGIGRMILRQGTLLALAGIVPGLVLAFAVGRALESLLAGVKPGDPATFSAVALLCAVMTTAGSLIPALRAARTDPAVTLRAD
ncbi:MAG TPA: ABC transporter permease [Bryobacteraceae bacterium]|nr:ABC transporter permease [Bryobacteraceae bacterium]